MTGWVHNGSPRARRWSPALALTLTAFVVLLWPGASQAQSVTSYEAAASADAVRFRGGSEGTPLTRTPLNSGGPTAQASQDSLGNTVGFAAVPDPGPFAAGLPGLAAGLASGGVPTELPEFPSYPLMVSTSGPGQRQELGDGPYELLAESTGATTTGSALTGGTSEGDGAVRLVARSSVVEDDEVVIAVAESVSESVVAGPLSFGTVVSRAVVTLDKASGTIDTQTEMQVTAAAVGTIPITIGPDGIDVGSVPFPAPIEETVQSLLGAAGVEVEYQEAQEFEGAAIAPTLTIVMPFDFSSAPVDEIAALGAGDVEMTFGGATARIGSRAPAPGFATPDDPVGPLPDAPTGKGGVGGASADPGASGVVAGGSSAASPTGGQNLGAGPVEGATAVRSEADLWHVRVSYALLTGCALLAGSAGRRLRSKGTAT